MLGAAHTLVRDFERAEELLARAVTYDPNCSWGWNRLGWLHGYRDRARIASRAFEKALRLSPLDPMNFNCHFGIGAAHYIEARHDEAIDWMEKALAANPNARWIYRQLVPAYADAGRECRCSGWPASSPPGLPGHDLRKGPRSHALFRACHGANLWGPRSGRTSGQLGEVRQDLAASEAPTSCECRAAAPNPTPNCPAHPVRRQSPASRRATAFGASSRRACSDGQAHAQCRSIISVEQAPPRDGIWLSFTRRPPRCIAAIFIAALGRACGSKST